APELNGLFAEGAELEILADGFTWSEGPVWIPDGDFLLFSDVPQDTVYRWSEANGLERWLSPSGFTGDGEPGREPGANGLYLDAAGQLLMCQHGDRRVARLTADAADGPFLGPFDDGAPYATVVADVDGKRFNSPNDLVVHPDGSIYFTDPPYGLRDESERELPHHGVYRAVPGGAAALLHGDLTRPNGVALSPDGGVLYVANSDPASALWMRWPVLEGGGLGEGTVLFDATASVSEDRPGLPDGMAVDTAGRIYATGPGGLFIFADDGRHLGTVRLPDPTANVTFGGADRSTLYITSNHRLLRLETTATGVALTDNAGPDA
ncbi:MAG: SMP-30/gluconolactonase/LRE family protein, partial [Acidobacteriota bacterium]